MRKLIVLLIFIFALVSWSIIFALESKNNAVRRPNVIMVSIDTLRADRLSCYGHVRNTSPHVDALAKEGVLFLNAYSHSPKTTESHMSLFTSLHHYIHKVTIWNAIERVSHRLNDSIPTLAEILKANNYKTVAFTEGGNVHARYGFDKGFDTYEHHNDSKKSAFSWLKKNFNEPFFLFLHTYQLHDPYFPPGKYNRLYDPDYEGDIIESQKDLTAIKYADSNYSEIPKLKKLSRAEKQSLEYINMRYFSEHSLYWSSINKNDMRDWEFLKAQYDADINFVDEAVIGPLIRLLKELKIYDNSLIIFLSDHGEAFNEHDNYVHHDLFKETLHVPVIMTYGKVLPKNKQVNQLVRLTDILPTILDLLEIDSDAFMQGMSLMPAIHGKDLSLSLHASYDKWQGLRTNDYSFILNTIPNYREYFYNRNRDPHEMDNLTTHSMSIELVEEFKLRIKEYRKICSSYAHHINPGEEVTPDLETINQLKSLGYLQ